MHQLVVSDALYGWERIDIAPRWGGESQLRMIREMPRNEHKANICVLGTVHNARRPFYSSSSFVYHRIISFY